MKRWSALAISGVLLSSVPRSGVAEPATSRPSSTGLTIPYVASRSDIVRDLLWLAEVSTNDVVYDLGSGDGRVVIAAVKDFGARRAVGIENDPERYQQSVEAARQAGVTDRVELLHGDLFTNGLRQATVVVLCLGDDANLRLRPSLVRSLQPGSRIVSHQYGMGEWKPDKELRLRQPYLGTYGYASGPFSHNPDVPDFRLMFDGHAKGNLLVGSLAVFEGGEVWQFPWTGYRDASDLTGDWRWPAANDSDDLLVRLHHLGDQRKATYIASASALLAPGAPSSIRVGGSGKQRFHGGHPGPIDAMESDSLKAVNRIPAIIVCSSPREDTPRQHRCQRLRQQV